jgi:hypothetical protein
MTLGIRRSGVSRVFKRYSVVIGMLASLLAPSVAVAQDQAIASVMTADGKVRVDILSLKRTEAETLTLRLMISNNSNERYDPVLGNIRLIDLIGRRVYSPGLTSPTCTTQVGQKQSCYAIFGAPPSGTQKLNIQFYEKLDLITGVPVSE